MTALFDGLQPGNLWKHFEEFLKIPHCSGNEKGIGDYIVSVAEKLDLDWKRDDTGNIVISKPASPGHEGAVGVILQGHIDMVCEKNSDVIHDFTKDPIQAEIKEGWIHAKGTTLGADNGIGCCTALAVLEDDTLIHPPLECLFTVDEERGLTGANQIGSDFLKGRRLLNLDSEDEGEFTIGCAGGADNQIHIPLKREKGAKADVVKLKVSGLRGGHSGVDINLGRGNAIKLLARILWQTESMIPFRLIAIEGGNLRNAIPREAWALVHIPSNEKQSFIDFMKGAFASIKNEYKVVDPEASLELDAFDDPVDEPLTFDSHRSLINFLFTCPHGVIAMHPEMEELVETSTNLAVVHTHTDKAEIICSTRSSTASALEATRHSISALSQLIGAEIIYEDGYPSWPPDLQSPLLEKLTNLYRRTFDKSPHVVAIHAGLECGIIGEKFEGMDMISFGPTIKFPHSPDEKVHIGSVELFWKFLIIALRELA